MAAKTDDINKKAAKLVEKQTEKGKEMQQYEEVRSQLQTIMSEQQNNLALEKQDMGNQAQLTETLSQAGAMAAAGGVGGGIAAQPQVVGPSTTETLQKFGMKPGTTVTHGHNVQIQPNKITVNNTYNNTTTNNISNGAGPLQGRPVQIAAATNTEAQSQARFKTWLSNLFAQQKEANQKRSKEYEKREWSLTRSANKMLRKMEATGKNVMDAFNPQRFGQTVGSQMKILMTLFAIKFLAKNWDKIIKIAGNIVKFVKDGISYFGIGQEGKRLVANGGGFRGDLIRFLGGNPRDPKTTLLGVLKEIFKEFGDHMRLYFEKQMALRGMAMKSIKFPEIKTDNNSLGGGLLGRMLSGLGSVFTKAFSGVTTYLGDILTALVDPKAGVGKAVDRTVETQANQSSNAARRREGLNMFDSVGDNTMRGEYALEQKKYALLNNALDESGKLTGSAGSTISQGRDILGSYQDAKNYGAIDVSRVYTGLQRLQDAANKQGYVYLDEEFVRKMFPAGTVSSLERVPMKYVRVENNGNLNALQHQYMMNDTAWSYAADAGAIAGNVAGALIPMGGAVKGIKAAAAAGKAISTGKGLLVAGKTALKGGILGKLGGAVGTGIAELGASLGEDDYHLELVPASDPRPAATVDGKPTREVYYYRVKPENVDGLMRQFDPEGKGNREIILGNIQNHIINQAGGQDAINRVWKLRGQESGYWQNQKVTDIDSQLAEYRRLNNIERSYDERLNNDAWSRRKELIGNNALGLVNGATSLIGQGISWLGAQIAPSSVGGGGRGQASKQEVQARVNYAMKFFQDKGLSKGAAAGIVGNLLGEGLRSKDIGHEYHLTYYNKGKGRYITEDGPTAGIAGFHDPTNAGGGELSRLKDFARARGKDWKTLDTQLEYLWNRTTQTDFRGGIMQRIAQATEGKSEADSVNVAARLWGHEYERFAGYNQAWGESNYRNRVGSGLGVLKSYDPNSTISDVNLISGGSVAGGKTTISVSYTGSDSPLDITQQQTGLIALVGDSYAVGMSSAFRNAVKARGGHAKATAGRDSTFYCVSGASIQAVTRQVQNAVNDEASVIVIHAGINNWSQPEESIANALLNCGKVASSGGAKVFLIAPITNQPGAFNSGANRGNAKKVARAVRAAARAGKFGLIDLEGSSDKYVVFDKEGIHPAQSDWAGMAKDVVELLYRGGGSITAEKKFIEDDNTIPPVVSQGIYQDDGSSYGYPDQEGDNLGVGLVAFGAGLEGGFLDVPSLEEQQIRNSEMMARENAALVWQSNPGFFKDKDFEEFSKAWMKANPEKRQQIVAEIQDWNRTNDYVREKATKLDRETMDLDLFGKNSMSGVFTQDSIAGKAGIQSGVATRDEIREMYEHLLSGRLEDADKVFSNYIQRYQDRVGQSYGPRQEQVDQQKQAYHDFKNTVLYGEEYTDLLSKIEDLKKQVAEEKDPAKRDHIQYDLEQLESRRKVYGEGIMSTKEGDSDSVQVETREQNIKRKDAKLQLSDAIHKKENFDSYFAKITEGQNLTTSELIALYDKLWQQACDDVEAAEKNMQDIEKMTAEQVAEYKQSVEKHIAFTRANKVELEKEFDALGNDGKSYLDGVLELFEKYGNDALKKLGLTLDDLNKEFSRVKQEGYNLLSSFEQQRDIDVDLKMGKITQEEAKTLRAKAFEDSMNYGMFTSGEEKKRIIELDELTSDLTNKTGIPAIEIRKALEYKGGGTGAQVKAYKKTVQLVKERGYNMDGTRVDGMTDSPLILRNANPKPMNVFTDDTGRMKFGFGTFAVGGWTGDGPANQVSFKEGGKIFHSGEYVVPKFMAHDPKWRPVIDSMEDERRHELGSNKMGSSRVKEPTDYTTVMLAEQRRTNDLLELSIKTDAQAYGDIVNATLTGAISRKPQPSGTLPRRQFSYQS